MKKTLLSVLAAAALPAALPAAEMSFEGRWLLNGFPRESVDSTCEVRFYDAEDAATPAATTSAVPFRTDADGYFIVLAEVPETMPDTFWAGVKPAGSAEIVPRMCVAPVPYALAAAEAVLVTNDEKIVLSGSAMVERFVVEESATVGQWTIPPGGIVRATNFQATSARLVGVTTRRGAALGLFDEGSGQISADYDTMNGAESFEAAVKIIPVGSNLFSPYSQAVDGEESRTWTFDKDGLLLIAVKTQPKNMHPAPQLSVKVGATTIVDALSIGSDYTNTAVKRFLCIPYRAGETVTVTLRARGGSGMITLPELAYAWIDAKVKLVSFGRP